MMTAPSAEIGCRSRVVWLVPSPAGSSLGVSWRPRPLSMCRRQSPTRRRDYTGSITSGVLFPANMVFSRDALSEFGGFDERAGLMLAAEDNDLCYRWLVDGRSLRYEPELVVWHHDWRSRRRSLQRTRPMHGDKAPFMPSISSHEIGRSSRCLRGISGRRSGRAGGCCSDRGIDGKSRIAKCSVPCFWES